MIFGKKKRKNLSSDTNNAIEKRANETRIINKQTSFEIIEAYKAARTNIMFSLNSEKGCKKVVISSPTSGEGKTTSCINIAYTFAETGAKVLIIDCDLRAPRIHKYLRLKNEKGLSNILAGFDKVEDCIMESGVDNLYCLTSGPVPPNPVELVSTEEMEILLNDLGKEYDYIFIDTPPINIVTEALILSKYATGVMIVTRQKYTMYKMLERAINSLEFAEAKILGFIINDVDEGNYGYGGYSYGSKKSHYSRYGYYGANKYAQQYNKYAIQYNESLKNKKETEKKEAAKKEAEKKESNK